MSDAQQENQNLLAFRKDTSKIINSIDMLWGELVYLSDDNSFPDFLRWFVNTVIIDIESGILDRPVQPRSDIIQHLLRFTRNLLDRLPYKVAEKNLKDLLSSINTLFLNWTRMIVEAELYEIYAVSPKEISQVEAELKAITENLAITATLERLITISNRLIAKAEEVLCAVPPSFDISRHYAEAIKNSIGD